MTDGRFLAEGVEIQGDPDIWAAAQSGAPGYKGILAQTLPENTDGGTKGRVLVGNEKNKQLIWWMG